MRAVYLLPLFGALCTAQAPAPTAPALAPEPPSTLVKPALDQLDQTITALRFDRWKKGSIRDEASQDSDSISNNLHRSLPPLLLAADAAPTANSKLVPAFQNVDAVYDVLLRVYSAARVVGQPEDVDSLQKALTSLSQSRRAIAAAPWPRRRCAYSGRDARASGTRAASAGSCCRAAPAVPGARGRRRGKWRATASPRGPRAETARRCRRKGGCAGPARRSARTPTARRAGTARSDRSRSCGRRGR